MAAYNDEDLKRLHSIELEILKEIIRVCEEYDLNYWIDWGTLLGAVRHGGFIPWDDDIDVSMPRGDYERFLSIAPEALNDQYHLQHFYTENRTPTYCAKIRKNGTLFVEESVVNIPVHQGIFVDVYPIDKVADDETLRKNYIKGATFWKQLYVSKNIKEISLPHKGVKKYLFKAIRLVLNFVLIPFPRKLLFEQLDKHLRKYENVNCNLLSCIGTERGEHFASNIFPLRKMTFENIQVNVPANYDAVLRKEYGDYMTLPSPDKRINHSPAYFDLGKQ